MKKVFLTIAFLALAANAKAQVPATVHATWTPNPATDNVTQYSATVDTGTPIIVPLTACTALLCTQQLTIPTFGVHTISLVAQNLKLSTDPTSIQSGPASTVTFTLAAAPVVAPQAAKVIN